MATRSMIYKEQQDGTLKGIYCHWDGCLEYNGSILMILSRKRNKRKGNTSLKKLTMFISKIKVGYGTSTDEMEKSVSMELLLKR